MILSVRIENIVYLFIYKSDVAQYIMLINLSIKYDI